MWMLTYVFERVVKVLIGLEYLKTCVFERVGEVLVGLEYLKTCVVRWGVVELSGGGDFL